MYLKEQRVSLLPAVSLGRASSRLVAIQGEMYEG
jgi:hypothetical protein